MEEASLRHVRRVLSTEVLEHRLPPLELPARYSDAADECLTRLFDAAVQGGRAEGLALVAVGGYGRRELCPGSDLDVLLLHDRHRDVGIVADAIWYRVWDSGVRLDHSVRTPKEVTAVARTDLRSMLGLLDARVVCGDTRLVTSVLAKVEELWHAHAHRFLPELAAATRERHCAFGELPYLLEPDLKESAGGLRDLEALGLVARALPALAAVLGPPELEEPHALLLSSRVALHARTGNSSDRLLLQEQDDIANDLGYPDADAYAAALAAAGREVMWAAADAWRRVESVLAGPARRSGGRDAEVDKGVLLRDGEVALGTAVDLAADPAAVLRVAAAAARFDAPMALATIARITAERPELGARWPTGMRDAFVSLLEYGHRATPVIEVLDRARLMEWLIPEWAIVRHRPQRNAYHRFTVDRHLLEAVAEAASLLREVERPDLLLVAALLHDIGKGRPGDHSATGRRLASDIGRRMGFDARDVAVIERLVKRHLLLADTATRRDIDDDETIELVAEAVGDALTLELLARLTQADSVATGPAAWGSWKASLVTQLVENVRAHLEGRQADASAARPPSPQVEALVKREELALHVAGSEITVVAPDLTGLFALVAGTLAMHRLDIRQATAVAVVPMAVETFEVDLDPTRPLDEPALLADLRRAIQGDLDIDSYLRALEDAYSRYRRPAAARSPDVVVLVDERASAAAAVVEVRAPDSHGLLHRLARSLAEAGLDVVSARIATLGHEVVDSFYVREQSDGSRPGRDRLDSLRAELVRAAEVTAP